MSRNPLSPALYLWRNLPRTIPIVAVIILAVMLITGIVALMNSIPYSIRTIYAHSKNYTGITTRNTNDVIARIKEEIEAEAPVELERAIVVRGSQAQVKSIVGGWPFVVMCMEPDDMVYMSKRLGTKSVNGRYPESGMPEAIISEPVARNLKLKLGDNLMSPDNADAYSPLPVKVVGIAQTDYWFMYASLEYHKQYHFPPSDALIVTTKSPPDQEKLDHWIEERYQGDSARVFAYFLLEDETAEMFRILYQILNVIIFTLVVVITLMMAMLMNIYQGQRTQEFGLLQALGYTRFQLAKRVLLESAMIVVFGWALGLTVAYNLLGYVKAQLMDPNAFALDMYDQAAYLYTIPVPVMIFIAAVGTLWYRFRKFDPVGVVERRLA